MKYLIVLILWLITNGTTIVASTLHVGFLKMVDTNKPMPGASQKFKEFSLPALSQGIIAFVGDAGFLHQGIFTNIPGYIQLVADNKTTAPSLSLDESNSLYHGPHFSKFPKTDNQLPDIVNNNIIFSARIAESRSGIYNFLNNSLNLIIDTDTPMPGGQTSFSDFSYPFLFNNNALIFIGYHEDDVGVFEADAQGKLSLLFNVNNTSIPKGEGKFVGLNELIADRNGQATYYAFIGRGDHKQVGVYTSNHFLLTKIADRNTKIPADVGFFSDLHDIGMDADQVAFIGVGALGQEGVYLSTGKDLIKAADSQDNMPGVQGRFLHFNQLAFNQGKIVFHATSEFGDQGVFLYTLQEGVFKLLGGGDQINGQEVKDVSLGRFSLDGNNVALRVTFKDGSQAIYIATLTISAY
jgi:hypothetical protein